MAKNLFKEILAKYPDKVVQFIWRDPEQGNFTVYVGAKDFKKMDLTCYSDRCLELIPNISNKEESKKYWKCGWNKSVNISSNKQDYETSLTAKEILDKMGDYEYISFILDLWWGEEDHFTLGSDKELDPDELDDEEDYGCCPFCTPSITDPTPAEVCNGCIIPKNKHDDTFAVYDKYLIFYSSNCWNL